MQQWAKQESVSFTANTSLQDLFDNQTSFSQTLTCS